MDQSNNGDEACTYAQSNGGTNSYFCKIWGQHNKIIVHFEGFEFSINGINVGFFDPLVCGPESTKRIQTQKLGSGVGLNWEPLGSVSIIVKCIC